MQRPVVRHPLANRSGKSHAHGILRKQFVDHELPALDCTSYIFCCECKGCDIVEPAW